LPSACFTAQEPDLKQIFEAFGPIDLVSLQRDAAGRSLGQAYVQCVPYSTSIPILSLCFCCLKSCFLHQGISSAWALPALDASEEQPERMQLLRFHSPAWQMQCMLNIGRWTQQGGML
jgi:hypothetical protein